MSYEFGACQVEELPESVALTNRVFRSGQPGDMGAEYPLVFDELNVENLLVARREGRIVSHVGICLRDATLLGAPVRVASIGAVATAAEHRGHGLASRLMEQAREHAIRQGASLMLISGLRGLYHRLGYVQVGDFRRYTVPAAPVDASLSVTRMVESDLPAIIRLHQSEPVRFFRSWDDWQRLLSAGMLMNRPADLLLIRECGLPVAYAGVQRPDPAQEQIPPVRMREWAGTRAALARALPSIAAHYTAPAVELIAAASDVEWNAAAARRGWAGAPCAFPGTLGIIDPARFVAAIQPLLVERGADLQLQPDGTGIRLSVAGQTVTVNNHSQLTALVFGGDTEEARNLPSLSPAAQEALTAVFPLPLFWYGYNYV